MKTKRPKIPPPEKRCTHMIGGKQCAAWRAGDYDTCAVHTPEYRQRRQKASGLRARNLNAYKNGLRAQPLKPLRREEDLIDHLTIRHYEIFLAALEEEDIMRLARLSTHLTRNALRLTRKLSK